MKNSLFTTEFDANIATKTIRIIDELYKHKEKDILPNLEIDCGLENSCLIDRRNCPNEEAVSLQKLIKAIRRDNPLVDLQYMVSTVTLKGSSDKALVLVFKGSHERADWIANLAIKQTNFFNTDTKVHLGFQKTIELFEDSFKTYCTEHTNDFFTQLYSDLKNTPMKVVLAGHSLGGALATLAPRRFYDLGLPAENMVVYSFGAPPVGSEVFRQRYNNKFKIHRFVNTLDVIPRSERFLSWMKGHRLTHLGDEVSLYSNGGEIHSVIGYIDNLNEFIAKQDNKTGDV